MARHTHHPRPWTITNKEGGQRAGHYGYAIEILDADGKVVCRVPKPYAEEKAQLILDAVNELAMPKCMCSSLTKYTDSPHELECPLAAIDKGGAR